MVVDSARYNIAMLACLLIILIFRHATYRFSCCRLPLHVAAAAARAIRCHAMLRYAAAYAATPRDDGALLLITPCRHVCHGDAAGCRFAFHAVQATPARAASYICACAFTPE